MIEAIKKQLAAIDKGDAAPVYLLFGDQEYLVSQAEEALVNVFVPEADRALSLVALEGAASDWSDSIGHLRTLPMFGGRKVVVVRDARLAGAGKSADKIFDAARKAWSEGGDARKRTAIGHLMHLLGLADWPIEALGKSGPDARSVEDWRKDLKVSVSVEEMEWLEEARNFAMERGMAPRQDDPADALLEYLEDPDASAAVLILTAVDVDKRLKLYKAIGKTGTVIDLSVGKSEKAQRSAAKGQIDGLLKSSGKKLSSEAYLLLEKKAGFNLRRIIQELEKIIIYAGDRVKITEEDVEAVVPKTREESIFDLLDAIGNRDVPEALRLLTDLLDQNHHPLEILGAIHREVRNLYLARDYAGGSLRKVWKPNMFYGGFQKNVVPVIKKEDGLFARLHPYVIYKALGHQANFERKDLEKAFVSLGAADLRLKSTRADPRFVLEEVVFGLCGVIKG